MHSTQFNDNRNCILAMGEYQRKEIAELLERAEAQGLDEFARKIYRKYCPFSDKED